jgi:hypothetical protein
VVEPERNEKRRCRYGPQLLTKPWWFPADAENRHWQGTVQIFCWILSRRPQRVDGSRVIGGAITGPRHVGKEAIQSVTPMLPSPPSDIEFRLASVHHPCQRPHRTRWRRRQQQSIKTYQCPYVFLGQIRMECGNGERYWGCSVVDQTTRTRIKIILDTKMTSVTA